MGEATKMISFDSLEDQFKAPTELYATAGSSFQAWQKPSGKSIAVAGTAEESTNPMLDIQLDIISNTNSATTIDSHDKNMENLTLDQADKSLINDHNPNKS